MLSFSKFREINEQFHPELEDVLKSDKEVGKPARVAKKIKELTQSGQDTGVANNKVAKGSSRLYVKSNEPEKITVDGKPTEIHYGMKSVISTPVDKYIDRSRFGHSSLGRMQNEFENSDHLLEREHRVLSKNDDGTYSYNPHGIFPPLLDHDHENHNWSKVGHSEDINAKKFKELTKNPDYPKGISHSDFLTALVRNHDQNNGRYYKNDDKTEAHLDHVSNHPLTNSFIDYQNTWQSPPHDLTLKNMGAFHHAGKDHIVARDHGFSSEVRDAYVNSIQRERDAFRVVS